MKLIIPVSKREEDMQLKLARLRDFMLENEYDAVLLQRKDNFSWLTSGGYNGIPYNTEHGECALLVTRDKFYLIANKIELPRIVDEEIEDLPITIVEYPWYGSIEKEVEKIVGNGKVVSDTEFAGYETENIQLAKLRYSLTDLEADRYRYLGEEATALMENYCQTIKPGQTEFEIAAGLNQRYLANGFLPTVTLVASDERLDKYRHPVHTNQIFKQKCMVVSCVEYKGLIVALTRLFHVGSLSMDLKDRFTLTAKIDAEIIAASKAGVETKTLFKHLQELYRNAGYPEEWQLHHQGGAIGYQNRDYLVTPFNDFKLKKQQGIAWNPSIQGTKSEDTILVTESDPEIVTVSESGWPQLEIKLASGGTMKRPAILEL